MDSYSVHLAMAALVGASIVAVSAYYMHRKTLAQLLDFAKAMDRKDRARAGDDEQQQQQRESATDPLLLYNKRRPVAKRGVQRAGNAASANAKYKRVSASSPDIYAVAELGDGDMKVNGSVVVDDGIPAGLPKLVMSSEDKSTSRKSKRTGSLLRPTSPKSPIGSVSAIESLEGSDEEEDNLTDGAKLDATYLHANGDGPNQIIGNGEIASASMMRSISVAGDLHGVQPDPIAADILRKEPEHESFARLCITPQGIPIHSYLH